MPSVTPPDPDGRELTDRQRAIIGVIEDSVRRDGYAPTLREIGEAIGLSSTSSVSYQLSVLQRKGYLSRGAGRPRTAVVHPPGESPAGPLRDGQAADQLAEVPMVGRIAAGSPILADQLVEETITLPRRLV